MYNSGNYILAPGLVIVTFVVVAICSVIPLNHFFKVYNVMRGPNLLGLEFFS